MTGVWVGSLVGAVVSGLLVLAAQWYGRIRERTAAVRALLVEMKRNAVVALESKQFVDPLLGNHGADSSGLDWPQLEKVLRRDYSNYVWTTQLPLLADRLTWDELTECSEAYSYASLYLESIGRHGEGTKYLGPAFGASACRFCWAIERICEKQRWFNGPLLRRREKEQFKKEITKVKDKARGCSKEPAQTSS